MLFFVVRGLHLPAELRGRMTRERVYCLSYQDGYISWRHIDRLRVTHLV